MSEPALQVPTATAEPVPTPIEQYIGLDLHKQDSQLCILDLKGGVLREVRIRTSQSGLLGELGRAPRSRILVEASTESEWVAQALERMGHEVIVADPNYAPMYASRSRKIKTDRRDARALADACRLGAFRASHRCSESQRHVKALLSSRECLVRIRTKQINLCRALMRQQGYRVDKSGEAGTFGRRVVAQDLPVFLRQQIDPLLKVMEGVNEQVEHLDEELAIQAAKDPEAQLLTSMPFVGPVTALAFRAVIDRAGRFDNAKQVYCYLGLVPSEHSSGGDGTEHRRGSITKVGDSRVRWLLVQAAHNVLRVPKPEMTSLWMWAKKLQSQRGKKIAVVALARRMAGILWAMMRDKEPYQDKRKSAKQQAA